MERCVRCQKSEEEVELYNTISLGESENICEKCALIENVRIIKIPSSSQLKDSEMPYGVRARLSKMTGIKDSTKKDKPIIEQIEELELKQRLTPTKPENLNFKLVDNFHWILQTTRRRKGYTLKQLAEAIHESESAIKMLENKVIPRDSLGLIKKLEQLFNINIIKKEVSLLEIEKIKEEVKTLPKFIPEDEKFELEMKAKEGEAMLREAILEEKEEKIKQVERFGELPMTSKDFRKDNKGWTVADLKRIDEKVEKDFTKDFTQVSKEKIGKEQLEGFGKEDTDKLKKKIYRDYDKNPIKTNVTKTPTIYELMRKKEENERSSVIGKDIEILKDYEKEVEDELD